MIGYIYKITNLINGKVYIGQHKWAGEGLDPNYLCSSLNPHFWNSIKKYGLDQFKKELIQKCYSEDDMDSMEKYWIKYYNSTNHDKGYNLNSGGGCGFDHIERLKLVDPDKYREIIQKALNTQKANHGGVLAFHTEDAKNKRVTNTISKYGDNFPFLNNPQSQKKSHDTQRLNNGGILPFNRPEVMKLATENSVRSRRLSGSGDAMSACHTKYNQLIIHEPYIWKLGDDYKLATRSVGKSRLVKKGWVIVCPITKIEGELKSRFINELTEYLNKLELAKNDQLR